MKIGLIDVDNYENITDCFPNLALMKLSAFHKRKGDNVSWYDPLFGGHYDIVYMSKVFSFTPEYPYYINADRIEKGGSGYCISLVDGKEIYDKSKDSQLPYEIEHIMPDYGLYNITDTAYGYMSRGCPRGCGFCHVAAKEGRKSEKVADLHEFWNGQKYISLFDPNTLACRHWKEILQQLIDSGAYVDFNQGVDIRLMTKEKAEMLKQVKIKNIHFAYDRIEDREEIEPQFEKWTDIVGVGYNRGKALCYVLCGYKERKVLPEDLHRIYFLKNLGISPYVMLYDKEHLPKGHELRKLQRYANNKIIFWTLKDFEEYKKGDM